MNVCCTAVWLESLRLLPLPGGRRAAVRPGLPRATEGGRPADYENASDQALIDASLSGDGDAFARLVERYQQATAGVLWRFTRDRLVLEELVQDAFVEAYLSLGRFRKDAPFLPWLRTIATRVGYRYWRRNRQQRDRQAALAQWRRLDGPVPAAQERPDAAEALFGLLEALGPKDRLVLTLQYFEGCNTKEIAERTGWTAALVKVRAFRARQRLRALLLEAERSDEQA